MHVLFIHSRSLPNAGTRSCIPTRIIFMTPRNLIERGPTAGMYVPGFTVCSFMFSCASVKMLIDNCVAPPPTATSAAATAVNCRGRGGGCCPRSRVVTLRLHLARYPRDHHIVYRVFSITHRR